MVSADVPLQTWTRLDAVIHLLDHAARLTLDSTQAQDLGSAHYTFGHGIYLAWAQACAMRPPDHEVAEPGLIGEMGIAQLLAAAEEYTWGLPTHVGEFSGLSQLVGDLCDLIREARALGY